MKPKLYHSMIIMGLLTFALGAFIFSTSNGFPSGTSEKGWESQYKAFKITENRYYIGFGLAFLGLCLFIMGLTVGVIKHRLSTKMR